MTQTYPTPHHEAFSAFTGTWSGTTKLYLEPGVMRSESPIAASVHVVSGGYALLFGYVGSHGEDRTAGTMLISYDEQADRHAIGWVDSFHSPALMCLSGDRPAGGGIEVQGTYDVGDGKTYGWHIELQLQAPESIALRMYNVMPGEERALAVETLLERS